MVLLFSIQDQTIKKLSITEFLQYKESINAIDPDVDIDAFE
jgi:hypothetical protein